MENGKGRLWRLTGIFFAGMLVFTLLSRAVYQSGVAVVTTTAPSNGAIAHNVRLTGKTVQNQERAVTTVAGLRVAAVNAGEGQQVAQGDVLFTLDLEFLEETILRQKQDMEKQRLSIQDAQSQINASQKQRANQKAQAEENYDSAVSQAEIALDRAEEKLERAETALENFYNGVSENQEEEETLVAAAQEAKVAYDQAVAALEALKQEIEAAVQAARDAAAGENPEEPRDLEAVELSVREGYAGALADAQEAADQAKAEAETAEAALEEFRQKPSEAISEEELLAAVESAQRGYDDALAALENAETVYGRAIASASLPTGSNHSVQIGQITYDQMELALSKLETLREAEGKILAPVEGVVTGCYVQTGGKTTDSTAMLLADLSQGCKFAGLVTEEQSKYIGVGDKVTLRTESNGKMHKDLAVTTFSAAGTEGYRLTVALPAGLLPLGASAELLFTRKSQPYTCCVPLSALHLDAHGQPYVLAAEEVNTVLGTQLQAKKVSVTVLDQNETMAALAEGAVGGGQKIIVGSDRAVDSGSRIRVE